MRAFFAFAALLFCACPARKETLPDGGSLNGPMTFRVTFHSSKGTSMYLQLGRDEEWVEVHDTAGTVPIANACYCPCGNCGTCTACPAERKKVIQVSPFASTTYVWPGFEYVDSGGCGDNKCQALRSANPGKYTAHFCWATSATTEPDGQQVIGAPTCQDVPFEYPPDGGEVSLDVCDC